MKRRKGLAKTIIIKLPKRKMAQALDWNEHDRDAHVDQKGKTA